MKTFYHRAGIEIDDQEAIEAVEKMFEKKPETSTDKNFPAKNQTANETLKESAKPADAEVPLAETKLFKKLYHDI